MVKLLPTVIAQLGQKMFEMHQVFMDPDGSEKIFNYMVCVLLLSSASVLV